MALSASSSKLRAPSPFDDIDDPVICVPTVLSNDYMSSDVVKKGTRHCAHCRLSCSPPIPLSMLTR
jgi:hypothetical protein